MILGTLLRVLAILLILSGGGVLASLLWPRITPQKPPPLVEKVQEAVKKTETGQKVWEVLGEQSVETDWSAVPSQSNPFSQALGLIQGKIGEAVTEKSSQEIIKALEKLPAVQQEDLKKKYCHEKN